MAAEILTPYNSAFRYPDGDFEPGIEDVLEAFDYAREIVNFVIGKYIKDGCYTTGDLVD